MVNIPALNENELYKNIKIPLKNIPIRFAINLKNNSGNLIPNNIFKPSTKIKIPKIRERSPTIIIE